MYIMSDISDIQQVDTGDNTELDNVLIETKISKQKRPSIMDMIKEKQNDQDFNQKIGVATTLVLELYKVLMGAMLVIFVPQKCGSAMCSISQNIERTDSLSQSALSFNIITALSFLALYFVEVKRENKMINYLEVNRFTPVDNETVGEALEKLDIASGKKLYQEVIRKVNEWNKYKNCGIVFGATNLDELKENIDSFDDLIVLLPGVGAQGGDLEGIVKIFKHNEKNNFIVNVSRALLYADSSVNFAKASGRILRGYNQLIQELN